MIFAYVAAFAAALLYGVSAVVEDRAAKRSESRPIGPTRAAVGTALSPLYLFGMLISAVAWFSSLLALRRLPLFAVQVIAAGSIGVVVLITWAMTRRRPSHRDSILLCALAFGLTALAVSAAPSRPDDLGWVFRLLIVVGVVVVAFAALQASHLGGRRGGALLAVVAGLADGGMALCARALHFTPHHPFRVLSDPVLWSIGVFAVIGIITFAGSLQRGPASVSLGCQQAVLTVVPSAIGLVVLNDRARSGFALLTIAGFVVTVAAVLMLTLKTTDIEALLVADESGS